MSPGPHLATYEIKKISEGLDVIEQTLRRRSEADNERFLKSIHIPYFEFRRRDLDAEWLVAIPNEHLYIPDAIYRLRSGLKGMIYGLEYLLNNAAKVVGRPRCRSPCAELGRDPCDTGE